MTDGDRAWALIFVVVILYDWWAIRLNRETLSQAFDKSLSSSAVVWAAITAHLFSPVVRRSLKGP